MFGYVSNVGWMWWDPSPLVAEPVVTKKLDAAAANQQQPHFCHPPTVLSKEKKSRWIIISVSQQIDSNVRSSTVKKFNEAIVSSHLADPSSLSHTKMWDHNHCKKFSPLLSKKFLLAKLLILGGCCKIELHLFLLTVFIPPPSHTKKFELTNTLTAKKFSPLLSKIISPSVFLPETPCQAPDVVDPLNKKVSCHLYHFLVHLHQLISNACCAPRMVCFGLSFVS